MNDIEIIRGLAKEFAETAFSQKCFERIERYRAINAKELVRPPVLVFEVPWGEINSDELKCFCQNDHYRHIEGMMRRDLFQFKYFEGDYTVRPYIASGVAVNNTGTGIAVKEKIINSTSGAYICAHEYEDVIPDEEALEKVQLPVITHNQEVTDNNYNFYCELFNNIMPVRLGGVGLYFAAWDWIPIYHGVNNTLCDLYDRPDFMHKMIEKFTQINEATLDQYEALNVLDGDALYIHCTPASTRESDLPNKDIKSQKVLLKDIWIRAMAQIFDVVSPEMHEEFDLKYTKRLFDRCGLAYYGCCEALDKKIYKLKQFKNLRRISITPWADVESAAEQTGGDYVFSYKPNPAFVAGSSFDPEPVRAEITRVLNACKRNKTPCEFVLKDISTVKNDHTRLTKWVETVNAVIEKVW